jgi:hypothetical protein
MVSYYTQKTQHVLTVGLAAVKFPVPKRSDTVTQPEAIFIQGIPTNTGKFWIGGSDVVANYTKGAFLFPSGLADALLPFVDDENLWVVSDQAAQTLMITYMADPA